MFWRMVRGTFFRQKGKMLMIAFTIALGSSLATAMLNVMFDVGDKVNQELKTYGANINVLPQGASLLDSLYGMAEGEGVSDKYLLEEDLGKIKTIFWAFNIVDFTPYLSLNARLGSPSEGVNGINGTTGINGMNSMEVKVCGAWFSHHLELPTGEALDTGMSRMKNWWELSGVWPADGPMDGDGSGDTGRNTGGNSAMVGSAVARRASVSTGDTIRVETSGAAMDFRVASVFNAGGAEDEQIYIPLPAAQTLAGKPGLVSRVEVSALTTPDNELSRRAAQDPKGLSQAEWETWYCTAYVSAICYQIDEVVSGAVSKPIRQVAASEGAILEKTQLLMLLITILSLAGSALGISNLVTAGVMERAAEIGLLKALGAHNLPVSLLVLTEILITGVLGGCIGYFAGLGFAQIIGHTVFGSAITIKPLVIPLVTVLVLLVTLAGSIPSIRFLLSLRPAEVLHGR